MCEKNSGHSKGCSCGCFGPQLWGKKKRIKMLEQALEQLKEREAEIKEALEELQA